MQVLRHCTAALAAVWVTLGLLGGATARQAPSPAVPGAGDAVFLVFLGGREVGREQVTLSRTGPGWTITATGQLGAPLNLTTNRLEITYAPDWQPLELKIDARMQKRTLTLATSFTTTTAINEITQDSVTNTKNDQITARTVVLPNNFYAPYEALAVRLAQASPGTEIPVYVVPQAEIRLRVSDVAPSTFDTPAGPVATRRYSVTFQNPGAPLDAGVTIDERNRLARLDIPSSGLSVVRQDLAGVATRLQTLRNPTDADVHIPAAGFSIAGTITTPAAQGRLRHPAVLLVPGAGAADRDAAVAGIPLFAQLAGALADKGFVVLRYDKRGIGQSGGRTETVTLRDYAEDAIAAVKWLARRKDVNDRTIFVVGHSEGASVAMLAAREKRIAGLVLMAAMGTTGRELILEQQQYVLNAAKTPDQERADKIELQKRILDAAGAGKGWESLPPEVRAAADTPWYRSLVLFDPARVLKDVKQPLLILHGELDRQVPAYHAERLAEMARARKNAPPVAVHVLPGLNHLFVPAKTGDISEYESLDPAAISPEVARIIAEWSSGITR